MSTPILAPLSIDGIWINELQFKINGPLGEDPEKNLSIGISVIHDPITPDNMGMARVALSVRCSFSNKEDAEESHEVSMAHVDATGECIVELLASMESSEAAKRYLLTNAVSFIYAEIRSQVASLFSHSQINQRIDLPPIIPSVLVDGCLKQRELHADEESEY